MMKKEIVMTGTGDALYVARMPKEYTAELKEIADYISTCDVRMTNFESNIEEFGDFAAAEHGNDAPVSWLYPRGTSQRSSLSRKRRRGQEDL